MTAQPDLLLVDAHVHFHDCFDAESFFDHSARNIRRAALTLAAAKTWLGVLMLSEIQGVDHFARFLDSSYDPPSLARWHLSPTEEPSSLIARRDTARLLVIAGRQIATADGLEVLALGTRRRFADGEGFLTTLRAVVESEALPVVPWGFGKWWFGRGLLVERAMDEMGCSAFFLGDSGRRPSIARYPGPLALARARGMPILPGSDPFPLQGHASGCGRYGLVLEGGSEFDVRPAEALKARIRRLRTQPRVFGGPIGALEFLSDQARLRLRRRRA